MRSILTSLIIICIPVLLASERSLLYRQLHAPVSDVNFWNVNLWHSSESDGSWPKDAVRKRYVGDWHYYYRQKGMKTTADDIIVAYMACFGKENDVRIGRYIDLGCGIGSTLLVVAHQLRPIQSIGIEAQVQSCTLLDRTLVEGIHDKSSIRILHGDLRSIEIESASADLITANPPYAPLTSGTLCSDSQRRSARFEMRGGIEDYLQTACRLLSPKGRLVISFWAQRDGDARVRCAAVKADLTIIRRTGVKMGNKGNNNVVSDLTANLFIYEMIRKEERGKYILNDSSVHRFKSVGFSLIEEQACFSTVEQKFFLDISRKHGESVSQRYKALLDDLSVLSGN